MSAALQKGAALPCDMERLVEVGRRHGVAVIEDAACAIGSEILWDGRWEEIGRPPGDVACFSFHPRKVISTGDGGMITTRHAEWDARFRLLRQHAMTVPDTVRHGASTVIFESYPTLGFNYRMTDIQAAVGREQLKRLPEIVSQRREMASRYAKELSADANSVASPAEPAYARSNWQSYCVRLPAALQQHRVMHLQLDAGISSRRGIMCSHRELACADIPLRRPLPHSEQAQDGCILLPLYPSMTTADLMSVASALRRACAR